MKIIDLLNAKTAIESFGKTRGLTGRQLLEVTKSILEINRALEPFEAAANQIKNTILAGYDSLSDDEKKAKVKQANDEILLIAQEPLELEFKKINYSELLEQGAAINLTPIELTNLIKIGFIEV